MSTESDGSSWCNLCGVAVAGGVTNCATMTYLNTDTDQIDTLHFCLDRINEKGKEVEGCLHKVLTPTTRGLITKQRKKKESE